MTLLHPLLPTLPTHPFHPTHPAFMGYTLQSTGKAVLDKVLDIGISILLIVLIIFMICTAFVMLIRFPVNERTNERMNG